MFSKVHFAHCNWGKNERFLNKKRGKIQKNKTQTRPFFCDTNGIYQLFNEKVLLFNMASNSELKNTEKHPL